MTDDEILRGLQDLIVTLHKVIDDLDEIMRDDTAGADLEGDGLWA
jgi:hypothetical protein